MRREAVRDGVTYYSYGFHEVYYDKTGKPEFYTEEAVGPGGETIFELMNDFDAMYKAFDKPVLKESDFEKAKP